MPVPEEGLKGDSKPSHVLAVALHRYLSAATSGPSLVAPPETGRSLKGDAAFEYLQRIVLATTAPAATLLLSLCLATKLLDAMRRKDDAMLKGFFYEAACEPVSQKVLAIWSVAMIIADANMNDNAFAATSWAQVTVFKEARVVAAWKRWAGDLMDWDFDIKEDEWKTFLSTGLIKSMCDQNHLFAVQVMLLQKAQAEKDKAVADELSQTQLHPTWTVSHHEQLKLQQQKLQEEQQLQQELLFQQQHQRQQSYNATFYATPPYSPVFQPRVSSLARRSLPVIPPNAQLQQQTQYSSASNARYSETLPPATAQHQYIQQRPNLYAQYSQQQQQPQIQLHPRPSIPRLSISSSSSYREPPGPAPTYTAPTYDSQSRVNSYSSLYDASSIGTATPVSTSCTTPLSVRLSQTPVEEFGFDNGWETGSTSTLVDNSSIVSTRRLAATLGRPPSFESFRDVGVSLRHQAQHQGYQQNGYVSSGLVQQTYHQPQPLPQQQQQQQQAWAIPSAVTPAKRTTSSSTSSSKDDDLLSTSLSSMGLGETPPANNTWGRSTHQPQNNSNQQSYDAWNGGTTPTNQHSTTTSIVSTSPSTHSYTSEKVRSSTDRYPKSTSAWSKYTTPSTTSTPSKYTPWKSSTSTTQPPAAAGIDAEPLCRCTKVYQTCLVCSGGNNTGSLGRSANGRVSSLPAAAVGSGYKDFLGFEAQQQQQQQQQQQKRGSGVIGGKGDGLVEGFGVVLLGI
ncbi:hypothetical protein BCR33DRAFT_720135, partial [Rhizoclosmatium globosum]